MNTLNILARVIVLSGLWLGLPLSVMAEDGHHPTSHQRDEDYSSVRSLVLSV